MFPVGADPPDDPVPELPEPLAAELLPPPQEIKIIEKIKIYKYFITLLNYLLNITLFSIEIEYIQIIFFNKLNQ